MALGGHSIAYWQDTIPMPEFLAWIEYFKLHPFDDAARIYRPAALISTSMTGADVDDLMSWLTNQKLAHDYSEAELATFKALGVKPPKRQGN